MGSALAFPATGKRPSRPVDRHASGQGDYRRIEADGQASEIRQAVSRRRRVFYFEELAEALEGADMVICGVNSFGVDWFMQEVLPHIPDTTPVLSVTKGLVAYDDGHAHQLSRVLGAQHRAPQDEPERRGRSLHQLRTGGARPDDRHLLRPRHADARKRCAG